MMSDQDFEAVLDYLRRTRGFDFGAYKRTTLRRRIDRRLQMIGCESYTDYLDHLEVHPDEFASLFNTILINVTSFFRDPEVWETVASNVIPAIVASKSSGDPVRLWSAGCASGEEAYTIAILLAEAIGLEAVKNRVKIYATDVDEEALAQARQALYPPARVEAVPAALSGKYFERSNGSYVLVKDLRRAVIFGRHDLLQDAPISRVDFLSCRNTLMYFNSEAQAKIAARFHYALHEGGYLLLGRAEMLFNSGSTFAAVDLKRRLFRATPEANQRERLLLLAQSGRDAGAPPDVEPAAVQIANAAFDADATAQLVVDAAGTLALANEQARRQFGLSWKDLGRPLQDLEISYRPVELRSRIARSTNNRAREAVKDVEWVVAPGDTRVYDLSITPLADRAGNVIGTSVTFTDISRFRTLQQDLQRSKQELETAYEELQSTNEELETTNEELQSTVEELETTNEELQSTNEELETMNEELQSTNEELQAINDELRTRSDELNETNLFMTAVLGSLRAAVVVIDPDLHVLAWNVGAQEMWGLHDQEVRGKHLLDLDFGLPLSELKAGIRKSLSTVHESGAIVLEATNRRGRRFICHVNCSPLIGARGNVRGAILVMEDEERRQQETTA